MCFVVLETLNSRGLAVIVHPSDVSDPECFGERRKKSRVAVKSVGSGAYGLRLKESSSIAEKVQVGQVCI